MTEALKILGCHLPCAMQADVDAVLLGHGLSAPIRWFVQMPAGRLVISGPLLVQPSHPRPARQFGV